MWKRGRGDTAAYIFEEMFIIRDVWGVLRNTTSRSASLVVGAGGQPGSSGGRAARRRASLLRSRREDLGPRDTRWGPRGGGHISPRGSMDDLRWREEKEGKTFPTSAQQMLWHLLWMLWLSTGLGVYLVFTNQPKVGLNWWPEGEGLCILLELLWAAEWVPHGS